MPMSIEVTDDFMNPVYGKKSRQAGGAFTVFAGEWTLLLPGKAYQVSTGFRVRAIDRKTVGFLTPHYDSVTPHLEVSPMVLDSPGKKL